MKLLKLVLALLLLAAAFAGGYTLRAVKPAPPNPPERRVLYYVDPMHPAYTSDKPGVAPDCGMKLEPVYADAVAQPAGAPGAEIPAGAIHIPPERQQLIGVRFATVERGAATRVIRTVGKVAADETRVGHVHTRIDGWIEKVFVDFTGEVVKKGDPMLTIYSPEMLASQQELLLAARARTLLTANPLASAAEHGASLFDAAKRRLQLWDLSDDQIENVLQTGQPIRSITVHTPMNGFVTERNAFPNQKVTPDSDLYTITDLSRIWIVADVFESDIASIGIGDRGVCHVREQQRAVAGGTRQLHPAAGRSDDAHAEGAAGREQPESPHEAGDVRHRRIRRGDGVAADGTDRGRARQRRPADGVRRSRQRLPRASCRRRRRTLRRSRGDHAGPDGWRAGRRGRHIPDRFGEPIEGGGQRHGSAAHNAAV
jgi:Barrel-sandwich domain of CusB or HlyD membrane-fusion/Heavy metal binding domain